MALPLPDDAPVKDETVADRLARRIAREGSIGVADYMAEANAHYYATRDPLGRSGDFITAPEISQMFGELIGVWLADLWLRAGKPEGTRYVELGPGRGTLAQDALRALRGTGLEPPLDLVEISPTLRRAQAERLPPARWHETMATVPGNGPLLVVANEFFDALPVRQHALGGGELRVRLEEGRFRRDAAEALVEDSPASIEAVGALARRLVAQGGAALIADYGHDRPGVGETLQAVAGHRYADPWEAPGTRDLTAHVDFSALAEAARSAGARVFGPVGQGDWLEAMGIQLRAASLAKAAPERTEEIAAARDRLTGPAQMGRLFKVVALVAPGWPQPAGF
ncbi:class I SAM-dependent methyltransferase [Sphingosinicella sp. CPCC 101087]|uniref:class I SAM-dependent methyltransferase n=1 Tax=Sphingosinicella sp. CPCC 101087 TaxID=2497754 RepID=UPI001FB16E18|nr:SAM-dependent methyltransferase [Sphingosinicella sp. CPCC 101087]